jgi:hypothetical protein
MFCGPVFLLYRLFTSDRQQSNKIVRSLRILRNISLYGCWQRSNLAMFAHRPSCPDVWTSAGRMPHICTICSFRFACFHTLSEKFVVWEYFAFHFVLFLKLVYLAYDSFLWKSINQRAPFCILCVCVCVCARVFPFPNLTKFCKLYDIL